MKTTKALFAVVTVAASALLWAACTHGAQLAPGGATIDRDDIAGVVTGASGPEAGVWVIAETSDLPTKFAKIVVTDDKGRYLLPDLPLARYDVWVRGFYGRDVAFEDGEDRIHDVPHAYRRKRATE